MAKIKGMAESLLYSTVRIEGQLSNGGSSVGTGFFFLYGTKLFVVTNKHVIKDVVLGHFLINNTDPDDESKTTNEKIPLRFDENDFIGHPDPTVDVAIANVSGGFNELYQLGFSPFYSRTAEESIPSVEQINEHISAIEDIVFVGYPSGIWDSVNNLPIVRKGITATPYYVDFMGEKQFLIDASVFPGSSGSPVFAYRNGAYTNREGLVYNGEKLFLLGIIARVYHRLEEGRLVAKDIPTNQVPVPEIKQMIDLGIVYKSCTIIETIEHYETIKGFN